MKICHSRATGYAGPAALARSLATGPEVVAHAQSAESADRLLPGPLGASREGEPQTPAEAHTRWTRTSSEPSSVLRTFSRLRRLHAVATERLERQLHGVHGLSINQYETLSALAEAPRQRMRRVDLAKALYLSPSGMTRLLVGLGDARLVERIQSEADLRVAYAQLTGAGAAKLDAATCAYCSAIRTLLESRLSEKEIARLGDLLATISSV